MKRLIAGVCIVLGFFGCSHQHTESGETPIYAGGREPSYGDYSRAEVDALKAMIAKASFPAPENTVVRLLPRPLAGSAYSFADGFATSKAKSKIGGNIMDYWLNHESVLRIATAYYSDGDTHYSMDEWAVVLTRSELPRYKRDIW